MRGLSVGLICQVTAAAHADVDLRRPLRSSDVAAVARARRSEIVAAKARARATAQRPAIVSALEDPMLYVSLWMLAQMRATAEIVKRQHALASDLEAAELARYSSNMGIQADVLRAQTETARLAADRRAMTAEVHGPEVMLNTSLAREPTATRRYRASGGGGARDAFDVRADGNGSHGTRVHHGGGTRMDGDGRRERVAISSWRAL